MQHEHHVEKESYKPLVIILIFCLVMSFIKATQGEMMHAFMGYFFLFLSLFKFFDLKGFVDGFRTYDLITKRFVLYGYLYPFIEFALGLAYLAAWNLPLVNGVTVVVMAVSGIAVLQTIFSGKKFQCACLGTMLHVPLSTVSVLENFGMGIMAAYGLIW